jgi:hypothetical protein
VFENRVLRRIFGPKRVKVTREWRKLHNEELNDLYCLPNIIQVVKSRRMTWVGHVACMGESRGIYRVLVGKPEGKRPLGRPRHRWERAEAYTGFWWGNLRERDHLENPGTDGRIILRCILRKWDVGVWTGSSWLRIGTGGGHL